MSKKGKRRWIIGIVTLLVAAAIIAGLSFRDSLFARDRKSLSSDDLDRVG